MTTWYLKECPKCGGDLYLNPLVSNRVVKCLQCSMEVRLSSIQERQEIERTISNRGISRQNQPSKSLKRAK